MTDAPPAAQLQDIEIRYGARVTIGPISAAVAPASVLGLIGPNGSGKTSIMRAMCGLQRLHAGEIRVLGTRVEPGVPVPGVGAMIEEPRFYPWLSAPENLLLAAGGRRAWSDRIASVLEQVGLADTVERPVGAFSQGMRQRLGVARALLGQPKLLVLDEPTNGLDAEGVIQMRTLLDAFVAAGTSVVLSSHMISEIQAVADQVLALVAGQMLASGTTADIVTRWGSVTEMYDHVVARL
ncbi:MAG: ABC transporter ATP-binding protein [Solirubrobacteraceae bacterium]